MVPAIFLKVRTERGLKLEIIQFSSSEYFLISRLSSSSFGPVFFLSVFYFNIVDYILSKKVEDLGK